MAPWRTNAPEVLGQGIDRQKLALGGGIEKAVEKSSEEWRRVGENSPGLWQKDKSVWTGEDENKWLGWLNSAAKGRYRRLRGLCQAGEGTTVHGCRLCSAWADRAWAPKCWRRLFRQNPASPNCMYLIPPIPRRCVRWKNAVDLSKTLFIVSSKSGGTTEPKRDEGLLLRARVAETIGTEKVGHRFHRGDRSRLVAGEGRDQTRFLRASSTATPSIGGPLLRAVARLASYPPRPPASTFAPSSSTRFRCSAPADRMCRRARKSRRATRPRHGACRS